MTGPDGGGVWIPGERPEARACWVALVRRVESAVGLGPAEAEEAPYDYNQAT